MNELYWTERISQNTDWATLIFTIALLLLTLSKTVFVGHFKEFSKITYSNKYFNKYIESGKTNQWLDISLFISQVLSFSFFLHLVWSMFSISSKYDFNQYGLIVFLYATLRLLTYFVSYFVSFTFDITSTYRFFHYQKNSYKNLLGIYLLPVNILLFYNETPHQYIVYLLVFFVSSLLLISYLKTLKSNLSLNINHIFYFLLYLCTLEIAPYIVVCYWFIRLNDN